MVKSRFTSFCLFLLLLLGFAQALWAQDSEAAAKELNSGIALNRLIGISTQLSNLNERLRSELQDSKRNSLELQSMLEDSKRELEELRQELEALRNSSKELLSAAENSQTELAALMTALRKAESSLMSLEISFAAYREAAESRISSLERKNKLLKWGFIATGVLAAGFGTAFLIAR